MSRRKTKNHRRAEIALGGSQQARQTTIDLVEVVRQTHRRMWWWRMWAVAMFMAAVSEGVILLLPLL